MSEYCDFLPSAPSHPNFSAFSNPIPTISPQSPVEDEDEMDIYRGGPPSPPRSPAPESIRSLSSATSSSSSSSGSSIIGRRLGAIAAVVEHAIARWARARSSSSSSSSSSASSTSSLRTTSRSHRSRRRKRRTSGVVIRNAQSERDVAARIRARSELRTVPRNFVLYLPRSLTGDQSPPVTAMKDGHGNRPPMQRVTRTTSLPAVLEQLDAARRKAAKARRVEDRARLAKLQVNEELPISSSRSANLHRDEIFCQDGDGTAGIAMGDAALRKLKKGKQKMTGAAVPSPPLPTPPAPHVEKSLPSKAWWLDIANPTWEDMRAIGSLLHLHPLTLEDILQQEHREKLEIFPKLGYYFIVYRAIESQKTRDRLRSHNASIEEESSEYDQGILGEANIYLVVFREGICSFHFVDISEHEDRVRNRLLLQDESINMANTSSDWIAHGIMDSVVDSFFPFLEEVDKEVSDIDALVFARDRIPDPHSLGSVQRRVAEPPESKLPQENEKTNSSETITPGLLDEKQDSTSYKLDRPRVTRFSLPRPPIPLLFCRIGRFLHLRSRANIVNIRIVSAGTTTTLRRIAKARRLVTTLTRLLAMKSEVVAHIRKRLLTSGEGGLPNRSGTGDDTEVAIYLGDVQDHILTLQHSLAHYERVLGQSHPAYLSQLRVNVSKAMSKTDQAIMILSIISIAVLSCQVTIGVCSMNVHVPHNGRAPAYPLNGFAIVLGLSLLTLIGYFCTVRYWYVAAKRRHGPKL